MILKSSLIFLCASQYLNAPYRWAANGPFEFDCSGLVLKSWNDCNRLTGAKEKIGDMTSQQIYDFLLKKEYKCEPPRDGAILFYGKSVDSISHVAIHGPQNIIIEAGGAAKETAAMGYEQLRKYCSQKDARVRIRNFGHRRDLVASIGFSTK